MATSKKKWEPWAIFNDGPPCRECKFWKPQFKYFEGTNICDGIRFCQADEMFHDFSCFRERTGQ